MELKVTQNRKLVIPPLRLKAPPKKILRRRPRPSPFEEPPLELQRWELDGGRVLEQKR